MCVLSLKVPIRKKSYLMILVYIYMGEFIGIKLFSIWTEHNLFTENVYVSYLFYKNKTLVSWTLTPRLIKGEFLTLTASLTRIRLDKLNAINVALTVDHICTFVFSWTKVAGGEISVVVKFKCTTKLVCVCVCVCVCARARAILY